MSCLTTGPTSTTPVRQVDAKRRRSQRPRLLPGGGDPRLPLSGPDEIRAADHAVPEAGDSAAGDRSRGRRRRRDHLFPWSGSPRRCAARGIDVLIDGAHAPGMVAANLDVPGLGAALLRGEPAQVGLRAQRGGAFLWARGDRQAALHPLIVSHYFGAGGWPREFEWQGERADNLRVALRAGGAEVHGGIGMG